MPTKWNPVKTTPAPEDKWRVVSQTPIAPPAQPDRSLDPYEAEAAQFGAPVTPAVSRTPEEEAALITDVSQAARGTLEAGGMGAGAFVGGASGLLTGPGAVVASPAGAIAGGGVGYAAGKQLADLFDEWLGVKTPETLPERFVTAGKDVATGAAYEAGGQVLSAGAPVVAKQAARPVKWVGNLLKKTRTLSKKSLEKEAGRVIKEQYTSTGRTYEQNEKLARAVEQTTGVKFTRGQLTNDAQALRLEKALNLKPGVANELSTEQKATVHQKLREYYARQFPGRESVDDVINAVDDLKASLEANVAGAKGKTREEIIQLGLADKQAGGRAVISEARRLKGEAHTKAVRLYDDVPDVPVETNDLFHTLRSIADEYVPGKEAPENYPAELISGLLDDMQPVKKAVKDVYGVAGKPVATGPPKPMKFSHLRKLRTRVNSEVRKASRGATPNDMLARRLNILRDSLERTTDKLALRNDSVGDSYRTATEFYRTQYVEPFKQGTMAKVLQSGTRGEAQRVASAKVAGEFFGQGKVDAADDFLRALGDSAEARLAVRDYAGTDLAGVLEKTTDKNVTMAYNKWLMKHKPVLKKFDLLDEFKSIARAQEVVDDATSILDTFNKSAAAKMLGADPDAAIRMAFSAGGANRSRTVAQELLKTVKGNPAAEKGLKNSFADYILRQAETHSTDVMGNPVLNTPKLVKLIEDYTPAMRALYQGEPDKLKALMRVRRAYQILNRQAGAAGVDTAESTLNVLASTITPFATTRFARVNAIKAIARNVAKYKEEQLIAILTRASFDPNYAKTLTMMVKGAPAATVERRMNAHLTALGLQAVSPPQD